MLQRLIDPLLRLAIVAALVAAHDFAVAAEIVCYSPNRSYAMSFTMFLCAAWWLASDGSARKYLPGFHYPLLAFLAPWIVLPYHAFRTRGRPGWRLALGLLALLALPWAAWAAGIFAFPYISEWPWIPEEECLR